MKVPNYLEAKDNVILFQGNTVTNHSKQKVTGTEVLLDGSGTVFLYLEDYSQNEIHIKVSEHSQIELYMIYKSSKPCAYDIHFQVNSFAVLNIFSATRNIEVTTLDIHRTFHLGSQAVLNSTKALINMGTTSLVDEVHLDSELAQANLDLLNIGAYNDVFTVKQDVYHNAKSTLSNITNSLISHANAVLDYSVSGRIFKGNEFSSCKQQNKGIILDEAGVIQVLPKLYIDEYNVEASHGAAIGQMDEEQMYYLQSRGLTESEARSLIISGYTKPFVSAIQDEDIKQMIERQILKRINEANII
ncbi:MAG: SufD family Fe-S cluster assembly protein [Bacilli bacterium]|nr:SufD family Fe-S cluster assembly protein [Bacilli bacterium]MBN2877334.1 SufD family Fe-S cluster assembly protein [Bacilli bacterium]